MGQTRYLNNNRSVTTCLLMPNRAEFVSINIKIVARNFSIGDFVILSVIYIRASFYKPKLRQ